MIELLIYALIGVILAMTLPSYLILPVSIGSIFGIFLILRKMKNPSSISTIYKPNKNEMIKYYVTAVIFNIILVLLLFLKNGLENINVIQILFYILLLDGLILFSFYKFNWSKGKGVRLL